MALSLSQFSARELRFVQKDYGDRVVTVPAEIIFRLAEACLKYNDNGTELRRGYVPPPWSFMPPKYQPNTYTAHYAMCDILDKEIDWLLKRAVGDTMSEVQEHIHPCLWHDYQAAWYKEISSAFSDLPKLHGKFYQQYWTESCPSHYYDAAYCAMIYEQKEWLDRRAKADANPAYTAEPHTMHFEFLNDDVPNVFS